MAQELTIAQIIQIKRICQYLSLRDTSGSNLRIGSFLDERVARMIYVEGKSLEIRYNQNPNDPTLRNVANYVYSLLGRWAIEAQNILNGLSAVLTISGPLNQTVSVGGTATFSTAVTSSTPYTVQWYDSNNNAIPGATSTTYLFTNAQATDNNKTFYMKATNASQVVTSVTATLTVTVSITGFFAYMPADPYPTLLTSVDPFTYQVNFPIVHNGNFTITMPAPSAPNQYLIVKVPSTEPNKGTWFNDVFNNGTIPDFDWQNLLTFGGFTYYASRQALSLNTASTLILSP
jgi:hypothetical protein